MIDKLLILYTVPEENVDQLAVSLKTLEFFPPTVDYEVVLIPDGTSSKALEELVEASEGVSMHQWPGSLGEAVDTAWRASDANFVMLMHPDVIFLNKTWCDAILSKMIDLSIPIMGSNAFIEFKSLHGGVIKTIPSHILVFTREALEAIGGLDKKVDGEMRGPYVHLHAANRRFQAAGGDLTSLMRHLAICNYEQRPVTEEQIRRLQEEVLRRMERV